MTYPPQTPADPNQPPAAPYGTPPPGYVQAPPPGYVPAPPAKRKKKWPWIVGGILLVMILGCVGIFTAILGVGKAAVDELDDNVNGKNAVAGEMNNATADGSLEFTVTKLECGKAGVGESVLAVEAQGSFCIVSVTVKNVGQEAQTFDGSSQKAYDAKGTQYSNDGSAELALNTSASTFLEQINPGNKVTGKLVYDVPKGTELTEIELHESFLSAGVKIPLK
ncbi:DUF4352 domain-containing protein [Actinoplanes sp. NPDC023714]|uniref:DUF4352 domain-containing protein n=1 Tax=Actinoplanes sp. NPDC023714 TaxID=3154322 RepID=UPI0033FBF30B